MEEFDSTLLEQYFRLHRLLMHGLHERRGCARTAYSGQGRVLKLLRIKPEISQREMAEILGIRPQSLGETLNRLEAAGYIERRIREDDRRSLIVCLTEAGAEAARDERGQSSGDDGLFDCLSARSWRRCWPRSRPRWRAGCRHRLRPRSTARTSTAATADAADITAGTAAAAIPAEKIE